MNTYKACVLSPQNTTNKDGYFPLGWIAIDSLKVGRNNILQWNR